MLHISFDVVLKNKYINTQIINFKVNFRVHIFLLTVTIVKLY